MIPVSVRKWVFPSLLLVMLLSIVEASGAISLEVRKPGSQFSENHIETIRHARSGNEATTAPVNPVSPQAFIKKTDTTLAPGKTTTIEKTINKESTPTSTVNSAPLFRLVDICSEKKRFDEFKECMKTQRHIACKSDKNCIKICEDEYNSVISPIRALFGCLDSKIKCGSSSISTVDNALKTSVEKHCQQPQCTYDIGELYKKLFPECRLDDGLDCEPIPTTTTTTTNTSKEESTGNLEYVPPHEDLPEDFSCENLGEKYKACEYLCKQLASLKPYEEPGIDWRFLPGAFMTAGSLLAIPILFVLTKRMTNELAALNEQKPTTADDQNAKLKIAYAAALDVKDPKNLEKKKEKSQEIPSPSSHENNPAADKMRAKLLETQQNLQKLRSHAKKCVEEHKKDAASSKFPKKGAIYIPNEPEIPPPVPLPDNIILDNVEWCSDYNEMYVIGSDVDDIELEDDSTASSLDESTKIEKRNQTSKKSKKSKKSVGSKKTKSKKSQNSKKSKKDVKIKDSMSKIQ